MKHLFCFFFALSSFGISAQTALSINVLKPAFYFKGKQDFMTDLVFDHSFNKRVGIRLGLHGGYQKEPSGLPLYYSKFYESYHLIWKESIALGGSIGLKLHPKYILGLPASKQFYWIFNTQFGSFIDNQKIDVQEPCCYYGDVNYKSGFFKLGWFMGYDIPLKRWQLQPEIGIMFPWASNTNSDDEKQLDWVNEPKFQWHIALNFGYVFRKAAVVEVYEGL